jgi:hypothetical protein
MYYSLLCTVGNIQWQFVIYLLLVRYPDIAKDYLSVEVDTGQIVPLNKFVSLYESNKLATTLRTNFHLIYLKSLIRLASSTKIRKSPESEKYDLISSNKPVSLLNIQ